MIQYLKNKPGVLFGVCLLLFIPAYFINLGLMPILADEPTRAVVALEMIFSDNWWVPTINGEFYYRKPPVYNWLLATLFKLTGDTSEWMVRLPSVIPLFLYGFTIYWWVKKYLGKKVAFLAAVMFVTCGRMLIYSSMLGHIDILYSWVTFVAFIALWEFYQKKQWLWLFVLTYLLSSIAFLMKGLPTILFQGISLAVFLFLEKKFKKLFNWRHFVGILIFLLLVGGYFWKYSQYNDLYGWVAELWDQSEQRTVLRKAWYESILYLFAFPFEQAMHLAPWSILAVFCFRKGFVKSVWQNPFLRFVSIIFLANIPVYWLSPGSYPRYLFMLYPLLFIVISFAYFEGKEKMPIMRKWIEGILLFGGVIAALGIWAVLWADFEVPYKVLKVLALFMVWVICLWVYYRLKEYRFVTFTIILLLFRIGFDWFVLPHRIQTGPELFYKQEALRLAEITKDAPLYQLKTTGIGHNATYYVETQRNEILRHKYEIEEGYYIGFYPQLEGYDCNTQGQFTIKYRKRLLYIYKCEGEKSEPDTSD